VTDLPRREWREDRYGFLRWLLIPQSGWSEWWDRIHVDPDTKRRLRAYADYCLRHRAEHSRVGLPIHGVVLLHGPPGTGKSSLARGLAQVVAEGLVADGITDAVIFAEVDPHALPSQMLGESQRNTINLLEKSLPELAAKGHPVIVVIDEVNSLATSRALSTGGQDPVDVMRATEAVLRGIDYLAESSPNVLVIATSNFRTTIDEALLDRIDLAVEIPTPDAERIGEILSDTLTEVPSHDIDSDAIGRLAVSMEGRSGRDIRKLVLEALVTRVADRDQPLTEADLAVVADSKEK
jgi:pachytene checkpoint protein 2